MDIEKFKELVENTVSATLTEKEREKALATLNDAVVESTEKIRELSSVLEAKNSELEQASLSLSEKEEALTATSEELASLKTSLEEVSSKIENLEASLSQKAVEFEELTALKDSFEEKATNLEAKFNEIEKEAVLVVRMEQLSAEKILRSGTAGDVQKEKVGNMQDEEFASYVAELKELREEFIKSVEPAPVVVDDKATAGLLNFEVPVTDGISSKYKELGDALAQKVTERLSK